MKKSNLIMDYRIKYPETTMNELAEIITLETDIKITKSGINHRFTKILEMAQKLVNANPTADVATLVPLALKEISGKK